MCIEFLTQKLHSDIIILVIFSFKGRDNVLWPGLNTPIMKGRNVLKIEKLPPDPDRELKLVQMRDEMSKIQYPALPPLLRGWSGNRYPGQSLGPPDPIGDCKYRSCYCK